MRKIKEALRLKYEQKFSHRRIAKACHIARPTVGDYLKRAGVAGFSWPLPEGITESQLENALFPKTANPAFAHLVIPDWAQVHKELRHQTVGSAIIIEPGEANLVWLLCLLMLTNLAALRHQTFFSLYELNETIKTLLAQLNQRPFKKLPGCRQSQFEQLDKPALNPLPNEVYQYAEWKKARVNTDYHIEFR